MAKLPLLQQTSSWGLHSAPRDAPRVPGDLCLVCLCLLSVSYDPPLVILLLHHGEEIIYLGGEGLLREMDYAFVV